MGRGIKLVLYERRRNIIGAIVGIFVSILFDLGVFGKLFLKLIFYLEYYFYSLQF